MYECHNYIDDNNSCKYHTVTKQEKPQAVSRKKEGEMEYILYVCIQSSDAKKSLMVCSILNHYIVISTTPV